MHLAECLYCPCLGFEGGELAPFDSSIGFLLTNVRLAEMAGETPYYRLARHPAAYEELAQEA